MAVGTAANIHHLVSRFPYVTCAPATNLLMERVYHPAQCASSNVQSAMASLYDIQFAHQNRELLGPISYDADDQDASRLSLGCNLGFSTCSVPCEHEDSFPAGFLCISPWNIGDDWDITEVPDFNMGCATCARDHEGCQWLQSELELQLLGASVNTPDQAAVSELPVADYWIDPAECPEIRCYPPWNVLSTPALASFIAGDQVSMHCAEEHDLFLQQDPGAGHQLGVLGRELGPDGTDGSVLTTCMCTGEFSIVARCLSAGQNARPTGNGVLQIAHCTPEHVLIDHTRTLTPMQAVYLPGTEVTMQCAEGFDMWAGTPGSLESGFLPVPSNTAGAVCLGSGHFSNIPWCFQSVGKYEDLVELETPDLGQLPQCDTVDSFQLIAAGVTEECCQQVNLHQVRLKLFDSKHGLKVAFLHRQRTVTMGCHAYAMLDAPRQC